MERALNKTTELQGLPFKNVMFTSKPAFSIHLVIIRYIIVKYDVRNLFQESISKRIKKLLHNLYRLDFSHLIRKGIIGIR